MRRVCIWIMACALLGGCGVLPGEERAFAVCLGLGRSGDTWEACVRLPAYTAPGEYVTVSARADSLAGALTLLDASAPIRVHYGQVRMVILTSTLAESGGLPEVLDALGRLATFRKEAALCVTEDALSGVMEALTPLSGTRLSKYLEVMTSSRAGLGVTPESGVGEVMRMGQRQSPLLADIALAPEIPEGGGLDASAGSLASGGLPLQLAGAWMVGLNGCAQGRLTASETQLFRLMQGTLHKGALTLPQGSLTIVDASARLSVTENTARCRITLRVSDVQGIAPDGVGKAVEEACRAVVQRLAAAQCDGLGAGRHAMRRCRTWPQWQALCWQEQFPSLPWEITVTVQGET